MTPKASKVHDSILDELKLYDNPELVEYVNAVGQRVAKVSDEPERDYYFFVLDDPTLNAFTPGHGLIYIHRGLLTMMNNEAQLAAVLAHEIGHNSGRHVGRQKSRRVLNNVAANAAAILTGSGALGSTVAMVNQERISGFGREMELEADEYAAEYLFRAKYSPEEMLSMLAIFKDYERYQYVLSEGQARTYHGVFSSHPRSDKRLQEVVAKAGTLPPGEGFIGRLEWREKLEGVVVGVNHEASKTPGIEKFLNKPLGITFNYPEDWSKVIKGNKIILKDADKTIQLKITTEKTVDKTLTSAQALQAKYPQGLREIQAFDANSSRDLGTVARLGTQRVALVRVGRNSFHFQGIAKNNKLTEQQDNALLEVIDSFRRISREDLKSKQVQRVRYHRIEPGETFATLSANKEYGGEYSEAYLRLINGYYPSGEPEPGMYVKLVKKDPKTDPKTDPKQE